MNVNYKTPELTLKQKETLVNQVLRPLMQQAIKDNKGMMSYPGVVTKIYDDSSNVDVSVSCGNTTTVLDKIPNKTNTIFNLNDACEVIAPHSDLTNCYVGVNYSDVLSIAAENIIGTLSFGDRKNREGMILLYDQNQLALRIANYLISFYDFLSTNQKVGDLGIYRILQDGQATGVPVMQMVAEQGCMIALAARHPSSTSADMCLEVSNDAYNEGRYTYIRTPLKVDVDGTHALYINASATGNEIYGNINHNGWDIKSVGSGEFNSLTIHGTKSCSQQTKNFDKRLFYSYEFGQNFLGHIGYGKINEDGECVIAINPIINESLNVDNSYMIKLFFKENGFHWKITEQTPFYFVVKADKQVEFSYEIMALRRGFENQELEYTNNIQSKLSPVQEKNVLLNKLHDENLDMLNKFLFENMNNDNKILKINDNQ